MDYLEIRKQVVRLKDEDWLIRQNAAEILGNIGLPAVPALLRTLKDQDARVRRAAVEALKIVGDVSVIPALIEALKDKDWEVSGNAEKALLRIGVPSVPALIEALNNADEIVRFTAANALLQLGDSTTLPRKILASTRLSPAEQIETLDRLRRVRPVNRWTPYAVHIRYDFPQTRSLCQRVIAEDDEAARHGAQTILDWMDKGTLLRPSQRATAVEQQELLRAAQGRPATTKPDTLLRPVNDP